MILLTGGSGNLGRELMKLGEFIAPTHQELDLEDDKLFLPIKVDLIVHCGAFTIPIEADKFPHKCYNTNVLGTRRLSKLGFPLLYISTEYVFDGEKGNYCEEDYPNPLNFYSLTKLLGEYEAIALGGKVVRGMFKPRPYRHKEVFTDQYTSGDYADVMAKELMLVIKNYDLLPPIIHIGFERKSTFELAKQTIEPVPISIDSIKNIRLPKDTSLNTTKWKELKRDSRFRSM